MKDPERLYFPTEIAEDVGIGVNQLNALKHMGCRFYGRKTCLKWVREWLDRQTAEPSEKIFEPEPLEHHRR